ncbi:hypothetical protein EMPS_10147 [Entomortierella parvispora]|uniref:F-box domain-containing protein n=1 Tax=Entomortierella parvispora TaxID=205924 RepID=A0A9P3HJQ7_9FUNG|nr:hypothetical protein EMPS_10147 [Entomortierella parvispora]
MVSRDRSQSMNEESSDGSNNRTNSCQNCFQHAAHPPTSTSADSRDGGGGTRGGGGGGGGSGGHARRFSSQSHYRHSERRQEHQPPRQHHHHTRSQSQAASSMPSSSSCCGSSLSASGQVPYPPSTPSASFWSGSLRRFIKAITIGGTPLQPLHNGDHGVHPWDTNMASSASSSGSSEDCECGIGGAQEDDCHSCQQTQQQLQQQQQQQHPMTRHRKRSSSNVTASSVSSAGASPGGRSVKTSRATRRSTVTDGATSVHSAPGHDSPVSTRSSRRRSSVASHVASENPHPHPHQEAPTAAGHVGRRKSGDKGRSAMTSTTHNHQYRQHFTGHGVAGGGAGSSSSSVTESPGQKEVMKRRLSFLKSVTSGSSSGGSASRRGSAFSTKSQETAVNLTGINEFDDVEEYDEAGEEEDMAMDIDEEVDGDDEEDDFYSEDEDEDLEEDPAQEERQIQKAVRVNLTKHQKRYRFGSQVRRQSILKNAGSIVPAVVVAFKPRPIELPEILHLIFQFVVDLTPADDYSQREIYSCLLVSKQWYLVAQKTLWREIRLKNPQKLELFMNLLKRTDTVEGLGIERNVNHQEQQSDILVSSTPIKHEPVRRQSITRGASRIKAIREEEEESIASPTVMQKRLHERASVVRRIVLHKLKMVQDDDIMPLATWFNNLHYIELYICEKLTDKIVIAIAENCPQLQYLLMPGCAKITDAGISQVALNCPRIKHLDLRACSNISDESLILFAKHCKDLWHLNVGRVTESSRVTGKSVVEIAKNGNLNTLGLAGCAMTDDALVQIASYSKLALHRISLNCCRSLTSTTIRALMQCPSLAVLEIKECLLVTDMATLYRFASKRVLVELCVELQKRLVEYKIELEAMNIRTQALNVSTTKILTSSQGARRQNQQVTQGPPPSFIAGQASTSTAEQQHPH